MDRLDVFNNLVVMAAADGKLTDEEADYLGMRAVTWGITEEQLAAAVENAKSADAELAIPRSKPECYELLRQMILMMAADGELADPERRLLAAVAVAMEVTEHELNQVINAL